LPQGGAKIASSPAKSTLDCHALLHSLLEDPWPLAGAGASSIAEPPMAERIELCGTGDVAVGAALRVEVGQLTLAVFNLDGAFYVIDDACTHGPGSLSEGFVDGDVVECNFHNGQFNIRTGEVVAPPCMVPVKTYVVVVMNAKVFVEL
jgi:nitrite reductase/ring-hydroxylating ferredoxin subunit